MFTTEHVYCVILRDESYAEADVTLKVENCDLQFHDACKVAIRQWQNCESADFAQFLIQKLTEAGYTVSLLDEA